MSAGGGRRGEGGADDAPRARARGAPPEHHDGAEAAADRHPASAAATGTTPPAAHHAPSLSRRAFLGAAAGALAAPALVGLARKSPPPIAGGFVDDAGAVGHRLRDGARWPAPRRVVRTRVAIVGGGIAGLSAAWWLQRHGHDDFTVLELERQAGGNARWGENEVTRFPWAAHYVPVPGREATLVRALFEELGVLRGGEWEERHLAFAPRERLWMHGEWHADVEPSFALERWERDELRRFHERMDELRAGGGFTIPSAIGLASARQRALDDTSMADWLAREGFRSPALRWYVDYACRDDYGALARDTSAWAGVHYFAGREAHEEGPLTWPEGNGFIVRALLARLGARVVTGAPAYRVERAGQGLRVLTPDAEYRADAVIVAAPAFVASRIVEGAAPAAPHVYSPWLTANLTLHRPPRERPGDEPAWDNVVYGSPSLGYVVATHQSLRWSKTDRDVWTFYHALADGAPSEGRRLLQRRGWAEWVEWILADLARVHRDIRDCVERVDIMRQGHAMVRPAPGFLRARAEPGDSAARGLPSMGGRLVHAHSDGSGLSLFEEAQWQGVRAAERVMAALA